MPSFYKLAPATEDLNRAIWMIGVELDFDGLNGISQRGKEVTYFRCGKGDYCGLDSKRIVVFGNGDLYCVKSWRDVERYTNHQQMYLGWAQTINLDDLQKTASWMDTIPAEIIERETGLTIEKEREIFQRVS
ncbi:MAG: hypothetical protein HYW23_01100 [Candidatus Aenigmarchaeota archaeon]|nr:hypothetical protein [Candidatus Aenigmarchaeota archaeon]